MATRAQKIKLGVFLLAAALLFFAVLVVLTGVGLFKSYENYFVHFEQSVSGLEPGLPVRLNGMKVGTIKSLDIAPDNVEVVQVAVELKKDTPIKTDTVAYIEMQGITGLKYIELKDSTQAAERLPPGSVIAEGMGGLDELKERAGAIAQKAEGVLDNMIYLTRRQNMEHVERIVKNVADSSDNLDELSAELTRTLKVSGDIARENQRTFGELMHNANQASAESTQVLRELAQLSQLARQLLDESEVPETFAGLRATNEQVQFQLEAMAQNDTMARLSAALDQLVVLLGGLGESVEQNKDQVRLTVDNLRQAAESFKELGQTLKSQPSRLLFDDPPPERPLP